MPLDFNQNHFQLFGLPVRFVLDAGQLDEAYRGLQAKIHPDRFAHAGEAEKRLSMQWATRANEAYETLRSPFERARYLLWLQGVDAMDPKNTAMPADFIMQQMAWREALADTNRNRDAPALDRLEQELRGQSKAYQADLARLIDDARDYPRAAETLRKLRFMDKLLEEVDSAYAALD
ncbi:MAG TPA: Fe-S protein assembly co-chaperone HscB [Thiobacillaceae bacterium]|nr:Fe-S protein assembly co-chaperone HscB [Thiobacillaceae bacterium]HNU65396.1 Fe-S protein assembly co-chaperone HscB [Thiobacillaceae bacterium]